MGKNDERFEFYFDCFVFFYDFCRRIKQRYDSMENTGKIFGISLGPGDPELITLKALKALNAVEVIFCPGTKSGEGRMKSRALDILRQLEVDETKIRLFQVPMSRDRQEALCAYDRVCGEVLELVRSGKSVGITAEGDACFYSSAHYMYGQLAQVGFPVAMIAGVPAFIAAGASVGLHLVKQQERLLVIPGDVIVEELLETIVAKRTLVIMKEPLGEAVLRPFIARHPELHYYYFEQVGTGQEYYSSVREEILGHSFTYFSILVIKPAFSR